MSKDYSKIKTTQLIEQIEEIHCELTKRGITLEHRFFQSLQDKSLDRKILQYEIDETPKNTRENWA